jgi:hypothetical protein
VNIETLSREVTRPASAVSDETGDLDCRVGGDHLELVLDEAWPVGVLLG